MMLKSRFYTVLFTTIGLMTCGDVLELDITNEEVFLLAPGEGVTVYSDTVNFWWEKVEGANEYSFRVVSPSFDQIERLVLDSVTTTNVINLILTPGVYEWEVSAINAGYQTGYFYRSFVVDSTAGSGTDLSSLTVNLLAPADGLIKDEKEVNFYWGEVAEADQYQLVIVTPSFTQIEELILDSLVSTNQFAYSLDNGTYSWRVRAMNSQSETAYSTTRSLLIDTTGYGGNPPDISNQSAAQVSPADSAVISANEVELRWEELFGATYYELRLATPNFESLELVLADSTVGQTNFTITLDSGWYEWRIRGINEVSESSYSYRSFHIINKL